MFSPSAAPRWKSTTSFLRLGMGVAAMARRRNPGSVLMPIIATPPFFRNARRETVIVFSLPRFRSTALEFRRAEHQSRDHVFVHFRNRVIQTGL